MADRNSGGSGGISLLGVIFVVFLVLKLIGVEPVASWSWLWVTAPLWGGLALILGFLAVVAMSVGVITGMASISEWFGRRRINRMMKDTEEK